MNKDHKTYRRNWELKEMKFKIKGGSITLQTIIDAERKSGNRPFSISDPELLENCHPAILYYVIIDWSKMRECHIPIGFDDGISFGKHVTRQWLDAAWKLKFFNYDMLSNYRNIDQLRKAISTLTNDSPYYPDGFEAMEERLYEMRQQEIDDEALAQQREQERLEEERQKSIEEQKYREAEALLAERNRRQAAADTQQQADKFREMQKTPNSPWSSSVTTSQADASASPSAPSTPSTPSAPSTPSTPSVPLSPSDQGHSVAAIPTTHKVTGPIYYPDKIERNVLFQDPVDAIQDRMIEYSGHFFDLGLEVSIALGCDYKRELMSASIYIQCSEIGKPDYHIHSAAREDVSLLDAFNNLCAYMDDLLNIIRADQNKAKVRADLQSELENLKRQQEILMKKISEL